MEQTSTDAALDSTEWFPVDTVVACCRQAVLYHGDACAALGEDAVLEVCDWACRQLVHLNTAGRRHASAPGTSCRSCRAL